MSKEIKLAMIIGGGIVFGQILGAIVQPIITNMINKKDTKAMIEATTETE
jgi:surface antigen